MAISNSVPTNDGTTLTEETIQDFKTRIQGELIRPQDGNYDAARALWNGIIDKHPALIARCQGVDDVIAAVNFARENNLLVAVRGGGHNVAGTASCDGGLVIELSLMRRVEVDPTDRVARAEGGATWAELDQATQAYGLAAPGGVVSDTGIAGLTLGGGLGWLRRKHGLSCDNLIAADLVTADGHLLHTSEAEHAELLWGLRGGGGNFGVVTSFEFRLHPVGPEVMLCFVLYPAEIAPEALRFYRQYSATAPDEISSFAIFGTVPAADLFPQQAHGRPYLALMACHCGTVEQGERDMRPLRELATPIADLSGAMPFVDVQKLFDEDYPAHIMRYYWKSAYLDDLDDEVIEHLIELNRARPSAHSTLDIWQLGGAMSRVEPGATAFGTRRAPFMIGVESNWEHPEDDTTNVDWARKVVRDLQRFSDGSEYLNFPGFFESGEAAVKTSFGANYDRLIELKTRYDPGNLFRLNPNIKPAEQ